MLQFLQGKKTYIVAGATILYAVVGMWSGSLDQNSGMAMIFGALGFGAVRHGISTTKGQ